MFQQLRTATLLLLSLTILTGVAYPLVVSGIAQALFPSQANGSLIQMGDKSVGSELIGQAFSKPAYFWGRLSATGPVQYNAAASSGSNFGPMHPELQQAVEQRIAALKAAGHAEGAIPVDLVTASASGLDPHISPAAAEFQVARIAAVRKMSVDAVRQLIRQYTDGRQFGLLGEARVNVLQLNLALDQQN
ncbi:MAG: potassium-transporting ATPase subunit KdpC [Planctomycetota bacterium]|nr:potassium-transporting ATPase subunit KdpC [Planctomycetota bacterium]